MKVRDFVNKVNLVSSVQLVNHKTGEYLATYHNRVLHHKEFLDYEVKLIEHHKNNITLLVAKPFNKEEWVKERYYGYQNTPKIVSRTVGSTTYVLNPDEPWKYGWSKKRPTDRDNAQVAIAVAYARYLGEEIPEEI